MEAYRCRICSVLSRSLVEHDRHLRGKRHAANAACTGTRRPGPAAPAAAPRSGPSAPPRPAPPVRRGAPESGSGSSTVSFELSVVASVSGEGNCGKWTPSLPPPSAACAAGEARAATRGARGGYAEEFRLRPPSEDASEDWVEHFTARLLRGRRG